MRNIAANDRNTNLKLRNSSNLKKLVWNYFENRRRLLSGVASAIKSCLPLPFNYYEPIENRHPTFMAGNILFLYHRFIEEQSREAILLKRDSIERKSSSCSVCGVDLKVVYGQAGCNILEYHYAVDVTKYHNGMQILPAGLRQYVRLVTNWRTWTPYFLKKKQ